MSGTWMEAWQRSFDRNTVATTHTQTLFVGESNCFWTCIKPLQNGQYIMCGSTGVKHDSTGIDKGIIYVGSLQTDNFSPTYEIIAPFSNVQLTSFGGIEPIYSQNGTTQQYAISGTYFASQSTYVAFIFVGTLDDLTNPDNYTTFQINGGETHLYGLTVGYQNRGESYTILAVGNCIIEGLPSGFVYNWGNGQHHTVVYPDATLTTALDICWLGSTEYAICGGFSYNITQMSEIYWHNPSTSAPTGYAYIMIYDADSETFAFWNSFQSENPAHVVQFHGMCLADPLTRTHSAHRSNVTFKVTANSVPYLKKLLDSQLENTVGSCWSIQLNSTSGQYTVQSRVPIYTAKNTNITYAGGVAATSVGETRAVVSGLARSTASDTNSSFVKFL